VGDDAVFVAPHRWRGAVELVVGAVSILHAVVLGIVQGVAEYLPISSSGHLILVPWLLGWDDFVGDASLKKAFDVALHLGTLIGAVAYFRSDIGRIARAAIVGPQRQDMPIRP
jgi:undecaprenyl pyrophosphate phosphatase UppP